MSKASSGMKLVKWLASQADDVAARGDDLKRFGPQAVRVRSLLDFIPTMSDDAARASNDARNVMRNAGDPAVTDAYIAAYRAASNAGRNAGRNAGHAADAAYDAAYDAARHDAYDAAGDAAYGDAVGDLISPEHYRILTNPLAAGRAVDVLGNRPRNQGSPFYNIVRQLGDSGILRTPRDVVAASHLAKLPNNVRETALTILTDPDGTYTLQDLKSLLSSARLLA